MKAQFDQALMQQRYLAYGIPSSSSHTLIGGFAGAAIAHALMIKGIDYSWAKIVDADTILKTILFIFLAPIIGIIISIFITVVTIMRNVWWRLLIISLVEQEMTLLIPLGTLFFMVVKEMTA